MPTVYRVELATSGRAGCKNTECKTSGLKIEKGDLRFGTLVTIQERQSWSWKHWGCTTPQQLGNLKTTIEGNLDYLDGYEELPPDLQAVVARAVENGHVDDADWKGDLDKNRPGEKGFRSPAPKKNAGKEEEAKNLDNGEGKADSSKSKPSKKKRSAIKDEEDDDHELKPKKDKAAAKRRKKVYEENEESDDEAPPPKKSRGLSGKMKAKEAMPPGAVAKQEDVELEGVQAPAEKKSKSSKKVASTNSIQQEGGHDKEDTTSIPISKKARTSGKAAAPKSNQPESGKDLRDETAKPVARKSRGSRKILADKPAEEKKVESDFEEEALDPESEAEGKAKPSKTSKLKQSRNNGGNAASTKGTRKGNRSEAI